MDLGSLNDPTVLIAGAGVLMILLSLLNFEERWWLAVGGAVTIVLALGKDFLPLLF